MKLCRTLLCMILALCLTLAPLSVSAAAAEAPTRSFAYEETLAAVLKALGLFRGISELDFDLDSAPSRAQALVMMLRLMGLEQAVSSEFGKHPFRDMADCGWAEQYVGYAYRHGLTRGIADTLFGGLHPADCRTYLTFVLRALGYTEGEDGDFLWEDPTELAASLGLLPAEVRTEDFRRGDVVTVSYAALGAKLKDSDETLAQSLAARGVLSQEALDAYYDPAAIASGALSEPYAANAAQFIRAQRLPLGADISGLPVSYHGTVVQIGDAGYELFGFYQSGARRVAQQIGAAADALAGKARVFGIIVPNSLGALLSYEDFTRMCPKTQKTEQEAIAYAYEQMGQNTITVDAMSNLRLHNTDPIFFRTDHHWTALGSYYAYQAWAEAAGLTPVNLDRFDLVSRSGHLGLFYNYCGKPAVMRQNPDTVDAYVPRSSFTCSPSNAMDFTAGGYNVFLGGDRALTKIVNNDIDDDSACLLVKDSYGNPFAVWLTQHYHTVYVVDYRHFKGGDGCQTFSQFAELRGVRDFIVLLPMTLSQADTTATYLSSICR